MSKFTGAFALILVLALLAACLPAPSEADDSVSSKIKAWARDNGVELNESLIVAVGLLNAIPTELAPYSVKMFPPLLLNGIWYSFIRTTVFTVEDQETLLTLLRAGGNYTLMTGKSFLALQEAKAEIEGLLVTNGFTDYKVDLPLEITGFHLRIESNGHEIFDLRLKPPDPSGKGYVISFSVKGQAFAGFNKETDCWTVGTVVSTVDYLNKNKEAVTMFLGSTPEMAQAWIDILNRALTTWLRG